VQGTTLQDMTLVDESVMSVVGFLAFSESPKKFRQDGAGKIGTQAYMLYECICPEPHTRPKLHQIIFACYLQPWLGPLLAVLQYVV